MNDVIRRIAFIVVLISLTVLGFTACSMKRFTEVWVYNEHNEVTHKIKLDPDYEVVDYNLDYEAKTLTINLKENRE